MKLLRKPVRLPRKPAQELEREKSNNMFDTYQNTFEIGGVTVYKTYTAIENLKPDPQNPRDITEEKTHDLIEFVQKYGTFKPVLVDFREEKMGQLIGGNKRLEAYRTMGIREVWIEPRVPGSDAEAFEMGTLDNMAFGYYVEDKLKAEIRKYEDELGDDIEKLEAQIKEPSSFEELLKTQTPQKHKYEIIIRCVDENDMKDKFSKIAALGIPLKAK